MRFAQLRTRRPIVCGSAGPRGGNQAKPGRPDVGDLKPGHQTAGHSIKVYTKQPGHACVGDYKRLEIERKSHLNNIPLTYSAPTQTNERRIISTSVYAEAYILRGDSGVRKRELRQS